MLPTEIESFADGFELTAANFSAGEFANINPTGNAWAINGATPSFSTKAGQSGMDFTGDITQMVRGRMSALYECTIIAVVEVVTAHVIGGTLASANTFSMNNNANRVSAFNGGLIAAPYVNYTSGQPNVLAVSFCPFNGTTYASVNDGVAGTATDAVDKNKARITYHEVGIGEHRAVPMNGGWVHRVYTFSRALHYRDSDSLDALIATEMARIGL